MDFIHSHALEVILGGLLALEQYLAESKVIEANSTVQLIVSAINGIKNALFPKA